MRHTAVCVNISVMDVDVADRWKEQHAAYLARRERIRLDRAVRNQRRKHGLDKRQAQKLARGPVVPGSG